MAKQGFFNSKAYKIFNAIISTILVAVLVLLAASMVISFVKREPIPMTFGTGAAVVVSGSMEPTLSVNDLIIIRRAEDYKVGDIVVYQRESDMIVHRIVDVDANGTTIVTRGDANTVDDPSIDVSSVRGRVVYSIGGIGSVIRFLKSIYGIITVAALLLVVYSLKLIFGKGGEQETKA